MAGVQMTRVEPAVPRANVVERARRPRRAVADVERPGVCPAAGRLDVEADDARALAGAPAATAAPMPEPPPMTAMTLVSEIEEVWSCLAVNRSIANPQLRDCGRRRGQIIDGREVADAGRRPCASCSTTSADDAGARSARPAPRRDPQTDAPIQTADHRHEQDDGQQRVEDRQRSDDGSATIASSTPSARRRLPPAARPPARGDRPRPD